MASQSRIMFLENVKRESKDLIFVRTTCPSLEEARAIGLAVIEKKLAISADYWVMESIYPWKGVIQQAKQYMLMFSSQKCLEKKLVEFIDKKHPYKTPMISTSCTSGVNYPYKFWMDGVLNSKGPYLTQEEARRKEKEEGGTYYYGKLK